jgi:hypothetical protein
VREQESWENGERSRVEKALKKVDSKKLREHLLQCGKTLEGLKHLAALLPEDSFPSSRTCVRCKEEYDPSCAYSATSCSMQHPNSALVRTWKDSDGSEWRCDRCGDSFSLDTPGYCLYDKGTGGCFEGEHTTDPELVEGENWHYY